MCQLDLGWLRVRAVKETAGVQVIFLLVMSQDEAILYRWRAIDTAARRRHVISSHFIRKLAKALLSVDELSS